LHKFEESKAKRQTDSDTNYDITAMRLITLIATALYSYQNSKKIEVSLGGKS
jgi:hypothetical protein